MIRPLPLKARAAAGAAALLAVLVSIALTAIRAASGYRASAGDERPPEDQRYIRALRLGLANDFAGGRREMEALARAEPGTSAGAWALYQAAIAAAAGGDSPGAEELVAKLRREYPGHPLTVRLEPTPSQAAKPRPRPKADCGPRSLLHLCGRAGINATLPELTRLCRTDKHGTTLAGLAAAARAKGFKTIAAQVDHWFLRRHRPAGIAWTGGTHYVAFERGPSEDQCWVFDPNEGERRLKPVDVLTSECQGVVLLLAWGEKELPATGDR